jgi:hypothetical protein
MVEALRPELQQRLVFPTDERELTRIVGCRVGSRTDHVWSLALSDQEGSRSSP